MAYKLDNSGNPVLVPGDEVVQQGIMAPDQQMAAATKTAEDLAKAGNNVVAPANIFTKTPAAQVYNPNPQSAEGVASDYRRVMQSIAQNPKESVGSGVNTVKAAPSAPQITSMEDLAKAMGYTSPEEEARLQKASIANRRMLAITDALRHIGNIAHTVKYAPSQQFNSPVLEDERRYREGKALRDAANARYISYKQAKERQDALIKRYEDELQFKRDKEAAAAKDRAQKIKNDREKWKEGIAYRRENDEKNREQREKNNEFNRQDKTRRTDAYVAKTMSGPSRRVKSGTGRSANGKMNYWIDVPGKGRVYFPNQKMWEQGIDYYDNEGARYEKTPAGKEKSIPYSKRGAGISRQANGGKGSAKNFSIKGNSGKGNTSKGSGFKNFSIH